MCFARRGFFIFVKTCGLNKILVIRFSSIGDIVLTTPVIRCLKAQLPDLQLHFLTKENFRQVVAENPHIDKIFTIREEISEVLPQLKAENYHHIVDLHKNFRSVGIRSKLTVAAASFPKVNFRKWLLVNFKINNMPPVHIVDRYFKAVEKLGVKNDGKGLDYFIPEKDEVSPDTLPEIFRTGYVALVIGGKHKTKQLPVDRTAQLCRKLHLPVVLLGGPEDRREAELIAEKAGAEILIACGKFNLNQSASLVRQARVVVTNDTGLMHIAAAFNKHIVSVWGNTVPEFGMYPYLPQHPERSRIFEVKGLSCRPCSKIGYEICPKGHFRCMRDQDIDAMALQVKSFWKKAESIREY